MRGVIYIMMKRHELDNKDKEKFGYEGFVSEKRYNLYTKQYNGYVVELGQSRTWHDNGAKYTLISILLCHYDEYNFLDECYGIAIADTIAEAWQIIRELELDSTSSAIQTTENQWLTMLQKALDHNCRDYFDKETNCYYFFEVDSEEYVVEIWASYCLPNGALTTMSYVGNIWADEMPMAMRKILW